MAKISGKPVIERAVERLSKYGIKKIYISVGHLAEKITSYLKNGEKWG
jgi:NDP-sugar pyrophosphorylase family protein